MGLFSKVNVNDAKVTGGGIYLLPGEYDLKVIEQQGVPTRDKGAMLVTIFEIMTSTNADRPVGSRVNDSILVEKDWGPGNVKQLLPALSGLSVFSGEDKEEVTKTNWNEILEACVQKPLFNGNLVKATCFHKAKKGKELDLNDTSTFYTRTTFAPHPETRAKLHPKKAK